MSFLAASELENNDCLRLCDTVRSSEWFLPLTSALRGGSSPRLREETFLCRAFVVIRLDVKGLFPPMSLQLNDETPQLLRLEGCDAPAPVPLVFCFFCALVLTICPPLDCSVLLNRLILCFPTEHLMHNTVRCFKCCI